MTIFEHELRRGRTTLVLWTACIGALLVLCVGLFPELARQADAVSRAFSQMGGFTAAFGMDRLDMGTLTGYYSVECGTVLGLGGAFFAALTGVSALAKEERDHTAEFLLTHPLSRARLVTEKLAAVLAELVMMNGALLALTLLAIAAIGEPIPWRALALLHGAYFLLQIELGCVCFGMSAFLRRGGAGLGVGLAAAMYSLDLAATLTERGAFLRYVTPFGYCRGADILSAGKLDAGPAAAGMALAVLGAAAAYGRYCTKDIQ